MVEQDGQSEALRTSTAASTTPLEELIRSSDRDVLLRAAADVSLTADLAFSLLKRADLPGEVLEQLSKNRVVLKLRKLKVALVTHQKTPRHVSVPLIRQFYTFDLMRVALSPLVPTDVKLSADEVLSARLKTITLGERLALARQASGRIAGALLLDAENRIMRTALENARLTEASVVQAVLKPLAGVALVQSVSRHAKWSCRRDIQVALLRTEHLSLARALAFAHALPESQLREILQSSRLPARIKDQLLRESHKTSA